MSTDPSFQGDTPSGETCSGGRSAASQNSSGSIREGFSAGYALPRSIQVDPLRRGITDISKLINGMTPNLKASDGWEAGAGSYLVAQYAQQVEREIQSRMRSPYGVFRAITSLSDESLSELSLTEAEQSCVQKARKGFSVLTDQDLKPFRQARATCLCTISDVNEDELSVAVEVIARATILKRIKMEIAPVCSALNELAASNPTTLAPHEYPGGRSRFLANASAELDHARSALFDLSWIDQREYYCASTEILQERSLSSRAKAVAIVDYLEKLTYAHSQEAILSPQFLGSIIDKIAQRIEAKQPLRFSMYLSLEKFANPLDTKDSSLDVGEMRIALELSELVRAIERITSYKPEILIINESAANHQFSNGDVTSYSKGFRMLLEGAKLSDSVKVIDFGRGFFTDYLEQRGFDADRAAELFDVSFALLRDLYGDILTGQITKKNIADLEKVVAKSYPEVPEATVTSIAKFVRNSFDAISAEIQQAIHTERRGGVDLSLLLPAVPADLLRQAYEVEESPASGDSPLGCLRSMILEQAKYQGTYFKALMRMRYFVQELCSGEPLLPREFISLSITNAANKLSVPMGRSARSGVVLNKRPIAGVSPQHGVGVISNGRIVSMPWSEILDHEDQFHPADISLGSLKLRGFVHTMQGVLADLDGTLKDSGKEVTDDVFALMNDTLRAGIPFGFATGRSAPSIERLVLQPFIQYLRSRGFNPEDSCYQELFISGNNGALTCVGLVERKIVEERRLNLSTLSGLASDSFAHVLLRQYLRVEGAGPLSLSNIDTGAYDEYCLYLEPLPLRQALVELRHENTSLTVIAGHLNDSFRQCNVPARALVNSAGIDIVDSSVNKGNSLALYRKHLKMLTGGQNSGNLVLCLGDNPTGNDLELLSNPGGRSDIALQGVAHVVNYTRAMLNIPAR